MAAVKGRGSTPGVNHDKRPNQATESDRLVPNVLALIAADAALA